MGSVERIFKVLFGLLLVVAAVSLLWRWNQDFLVVVRGSVPVLVGLVGLVFLLLGFEK